MLWIKDGKLFGGMLKYNGKTIFIEGEPFPDLMRAAPKRYSKLLDG